MSSDGTIQTLRDTVFNDPTPAEGDKVAAPDGPDKLPQSQEAVGAT